MIQFTYLQNAKQTLLKRLYKRNYNSLPDPRKGKLLLVFFRSFNCDINAGYKDIKIKVVYLHSSYHNLCCFHRF